MKNLKLIILLLVTIALGKFSFGQTQDNPVVLSWNPNGLDSHNDIGGGTAGNIQYGIIYLTDDVELNGTIHVYWYDKLTICLADEVTKDVKITFKNKNAFFWIEDLLDIHGKVLPNGDTCHIILDGGADLRNYEPGETSVDASMNRTAIWMDPTFTGTLSIGIDLQYVVFQNFYHCQAISVSGPDHSASVDCAVIDAGKGVLNMTDCEVRYNVANSSTTDYSVICAHTNYINGGVRHTTLNFTRCKFHHNYADNKVNEKYGGGVFKAIADAGCILTIDNCQFHDNYSSGWGGGILWAATKNNSTATITNTELYNNTAMMGGAISNESNMTISNCNIHHNTAKAGGAIGFLRQQGSATGTWSLTLQGNNSINHNNAAETGETFKPFASSSTTFPSGGGGIWVSEKNSSTINLTINEGTVISDNTSAYKGGGMMIKRENGTCNINVAGVDISHNESSNDGGGFYLEGAANTTLSLSGTTSITDNSAGTLGGGLYAGGTKIQMGGEGLNVMDNFAANHTEKSDIYLPTTDKLLTVNTSSFKPKNVGIYATNTSDRFKVITFASPATQTTLQNLYNDLANGNCNVFDDKQTYSADYTTADKSNIYFMNTSPWSPLQRQTTAAANLIPITGSTDVYEVKDVKSLTAFLWHVNGITKHSEEEAFLTAHPNAKAKVTGNIDMAGHYWLPIGTGTDGYNGTFDGNGLTISHITMAAPNPDNLYGMFGNVGSSATIKNLILADVNIVASGTGDPDVMGCVAAINGGSIINSMVSGTLATNNANARTIGGFAGSNTGNLKNNFAVLSFADTQTDCHSGGLTGTNTGSIANCYVRTVAGSLPDALLAYDNNGTLGYCYATENTGKSFIVTGTEPSNSGTFTATGSTPYQYKQNDNRVNNIPLKALLNSWVKNNNGTGNTYAYWNRPTTKAINGDYPLLKLQCCNAAAANADGMLHYGNVNDLLDEADNAAVWFYGTEDDFDAYSGNKLYIDEDAALKQTVSAKAGDITATVGITLDNSAGEGGANPTQGGTDEIDWHFFSTSLNNAPLGITYTDNDEVTFEGTPQPYQHTGNGYFPANVNDYYSEWDFYAYYEPEFQWINFKRNSNSHWNELFPDHKISYANETTLIPGKGYMVALADPDGTLLQCTGTLNEGPVGPFGLSYAGPHRTGLNLLGNPYQSYLDFEAFVDGNTNIWSLETTPYYIIMDEDLSGYVAFAAGQSKNTMTAGKYIHPHQGFMVVTDKSGNTATFTNDMRVTDVGSYDAHFRGQRTDYPLVNLVATDANGNRDIATAELGRPDKGGAIVADFATLAKCLVYVHYDDKDYRIAFTQPGINSLPVRFEAFEAGTFTLTWDTENGEFGYLHLIDNITGTDIDMLTAQEYTFTANTDDLRSRFKLVFDYTGIEEDENAVANANFAHMSNGQLVVEGEGTLQLIDINGRVLYQTRLNGDVNAVSLPEMAAGLYVLKLDGRTQKIVL